MKFSKLTTILILCFTTFNAGAKQKIDWEQIYNHPKKYHQGVVELATAQLLLKDNPPLTFEQAATFIMRNPDTPQIGKIKQNIAKLITPTTDYHSVYQWFKTYPPVTPKGHKAYAYSVAAYRPNKIDFPSIIKKGWIFGEFDDEERNLYQERFGQYLDENDHIRKLDYLVWSEKYDTAKPLLQLVSKEYHQMFQAQIALQRKDDNATKLFHALPKHLQLHSGVLFHYLNTTGKKEVTPEHTKLFIMAPNYDDHPRAWLSAKLYYTRELLEMKQYSSAYKVISKINPHLSNGQKAEAEWMSGWIALRFLKNAVQAEKHFAKLYAYSSTPISLARAAYWRGRSLISQSKMSQADKWFKRASAFDHTFYGALAATELGNNQLYLAPEPKLLNKNHQGLKNNDLVRAMQFLIDNKHYKLAATYANSAIKRAANDSEAYSILALLGKETNNVHLRTRVAKQASHQHIFLTKYSYPLAFKLPKTTVENALIYGLMRQESVFDQYAVSCANARGLMQIIPPTAKKIAKKYKIKYSQKKLTQSAAYNMKLGSKYLRDLLEEFNGSYILTIASYNAGEHKVVQWLPKFGDPRKMRHTYDIIDWIESIPYAETRNYVQRVLETTQVYRNIINPAGGLKIIQDLKR